MGTRVETTHGTIEGAVEHDMEVFRGVPYAAPPVGDRRFRPPDPLAVWSGVRDATRFGPSALQLEPQVRMVPGDALGETSEDCLVLNVWRTRSATTGRPVMVWIHGGGFQTGRGSAPFYDGSALARWGDVVVVTINYRLGALGFACLDEIGGREIGAVPNAGLLDQVAALRWVRDNAEAFGGDPSNVTIFGESAGGMSVGTLLALPAARGLFQRAIAQSGAGHHAHTPESASRVTNALCEQLGVFEAAKLLEVPAKKVLEAQAVVAGRADRGELRVYVGGLRMLFAPVIDGRTLTALPFESVQAGEGADVPLLVGSNRDEWNFFALTDRTLATLDDAALTRRVRGRLDPLGAGDRAESLIEAYRAARAGREATDPAALFCALETARVFRLPSIRLAEAHGRSSPAWKYLFGWRSPALEGRLGSCHALDIPFVFGTHRTSGVDRFAGSGDAADGLSERMMDAWIAFARSGDPGWPRYADGRSAMLFGARSQVARDPHAREREAWDRILPGVS